MDLAPGSIDIASFLLPSEKFPFYFLLSPIHEPVMGPGAIPIVGPFRSRADLGQLWELLSRGLSVLFPGRAALQHHPGGRLSKSPRPPSRLPSGVLGEALRNPSVSKAPRGFCVPSGLAAMTEHPLCLSVLRRAGLRPHLQELPGFLCVVTGTNFLAYSVAPALQLPFPIIVINELFYIYNSE